jgi:hypothetical protein
MVNLTGSAMIPTLQLTQMIGTIAVSITVQIMGVVLVTAKSLSVMTKITKLRMAFELCKLMIYRGKGWSTNYEMLTTIPIYVRRTNDNGILGDPVDGLHCTSSIQYLFKAHLLGERVNLGREHSMDLRLVS